MSKPPGAKPTPEADSAPKKPKSRKTTSIFVGKYTLAVYQRVAALRAAQGRIEVTEFGRNRAYSVSALIRETMELQIAELERELITVGMGLPDVKNEDDEEEDV